MGLLGRGDLHPGTEEATRLLIGWLRENRPARVLEVGAGLGNTARRLAAEGWQVRALEPDPILYRRLRSIPGIRACNERLAEHSDRYDAILAESVIYALSLPETFIRLHSMLEPGGMLAFVDMVWTERAEPEAVRSLHDRTQATFGIALASRERYTWQDWRAMLAGAGFSLYREQKLGSMPPGRANTFRRACTLMRLLRRPVLAPDWLRMRAAERDFRIPPGWLESWACAVVAR